jgi:hypothetical protein
MLPARDLGAHLLGEFRQVLEVQEHAADVGQAARERRVLA